MSAPGLRVDILFPGGAGGRRRKKSRPVATDVTITSALQKATPAATVTQRYAAEQAAKKKIEKYGAAAAEANIAFVPLAVDTFVFLPHPSHFRRRSDAGDLP